MKIDQDNNLIRRYLLGELEEADQTAFEQTLLADPDKFDQVWAVENELIDGYVRNEVSRTDRQRFESYYLASPLHRERVAIAESLLTNIDRTAGETVEVSETTLGIPWRIRFQGFWHWPQLALGGALALILFLTSAVIWSYLQRVDLIRQFAKKQSEAQAESASLKQREQELTSRNQKLEKEIADGRQRSEQLKTELERFRQQQSSRTAAVLSFLLTPALERSENAPPPPAIPLLTGEVRLLMKLDGIDYQGYQVRLQTVEGQEIIRRHPNRVRFSKDQALAMITIPAKTLAKGDYVLILFGQTAGGRSEEIDRYFFQVL